MKNIEDLKAYLQTQSESADGWCDDEVCAATDAARVLRDISHYFPHEYQEQILKVAKLADLFASIDTSNNPSEQYPEV